MIQRADFYRSREENAGNMFPRHEPIVHSAGQQREQGPLAQQQLAQFERDGFLWLENFFTPEMVAGFFDELRDMAQDKAFCERDEVIMDANREKIRSVFAMHETSEAFHRLTRDPELLGIAQQLLGGDVYIHQSRINSKAGFFGNGFEWHSDFETWHTEDGMPAMRAVSASIMLTDNNAFNGPLMLIPGSHEYFVPCAGATPENNWTQSLQKQTAGVPSRDAVGQLANRHGIEAPTGPAGSLLLFECNTLHASNRNMSPWPRANLFFVYNSVDNRLVEPFCGSKRRPEYLAARANTRPLKPWR